MSYQRVTARMPCPICGKGDWCRICPDLGLASCNRVTSQYPNNDGGGGWWHAMDPTKQPIVFDDNVSDVEVEPFASDEVTDHAYSVMLGNLHLSAEHRMLLDSKGIQEAEDLGYRTWDGRYRADERSLGVPGFYQAGDEVLFNAKQGILIPYQNCLGQIVAIQNRPDDQGRGSKYIWTSSRRLEAGTRARVRIHWAIGGDDMKAIWISEGAIKADAIAQHYRTVALGMPGIGTVRQVEDELRQTRIDGFHCVVVALDRDGNPATRQAVSKLVKIAASLKYRVLHAVWPWGPKGIDDAIVAGVPIDVEEV